MRVEIKHSEKKTGLVSKKSHLKIEFEFMFSEEEKAIIENADLQDFIFLEREAPSDTDDFDDKDNFYKYKVYMKKLLEGGFEHCTLTKREAHNFIVKVKNACQKLREIIDSYSDLKLTDESFEA